MSKELDSLNLLHYKMDLIITALQKSGHVPQILTPPNMINTCPICKQFVNYPLDPKTGDVFRACKCTTGVEGMPMPESPMAPGGDSNA